MQTGKLSEPVLKRSVLRRLHKGISVQCREYYGQDCGVISPEKRTNCTGKSEDEITEAQPSDGAMAFTSVTLPPGFERMPGSLALAAANNLYAAGSVPMVLMVQALLPISYEEKELQRDMDALASAAARAGMEILGGHTQVTSSVNVAV